MVVAADAASFRLRRGLCRRVVEKGCGKGFLGWTGLGHTCGVRVLKMDGPSAQGFLSLTAFQAEGCGIALSVHSEHILKER